jgi:hypothetical protein
MAAESISAAIVAFGVWESVYNTFMLFDYLWNRCIPLKAWTASALKEDCEEECLN